jgi:hypothetical protein
MLFPEVLKALWEKLPRLESIAYELWCAWPRHYQITCAYGKFNLISFFPVYASVLVPVEGTYMVCQYCFKSDLV